MLTIGGYITSDYLLLNNKSSLGYLGTEQLRLHYEIFGSGSNAILCFHGYGQDRKVFESLVSYRTYSFDLPFHGQSSWSENHDPMSLSWLKRHFESFLENENISSFALAGFSLGGKLTLALLELFPSRINQIIWIAPDGVNINPWYRLATRFPGKLLFSYIVRNPKPYLFMLRIVKNLGLMDASLYKLIQTQLEDTHKGKRVFHTWMIFNSLNTSHKIYKKLLNNYSINVRIYLAKNDPVINNRKIQSRMASVGTCTFVILETSHYKLLDHALAHLRQ